MSSIPRIRIHLLDPPQTSLSPSGTLDISDILSQVKLLPSLLAEHPAFDTVEDSLYCHLKNVPPFPSGHKPPFFILHSHPGDDEDPCLLLTAPTRPRMKLVMREQLYVQRWINTLTPDHPPTHIPWACEKPTHANPHNLADVDPSTLLHPGPPTPMTMDKHTAPLAARRGKSLSGLNLQKSVIEQLEYPDFPTAFLGSPSILSPRFDTSPAPPFTDHKTMLLDLKSKCAVLGNDTSIHIREPQRPQTAIIEYLPGSDDWYFARGLPTFDSDFWELNGIQFPKEITVDTNIFLPDDYSTPTKHPILSGSVHSTPASIKNSSNPPMAPLPPRPALVSPSAPPHVRGILKKAKSVRFKDTPLEHASPNVLPTQAPVDHPSSSPPLAISSESPRSPTLAAIQPSSGEAATVKETPVILQERKPAPRPRLPPRRTKAQASSKSASSTTPFERPCRIAHAKENVGPVAASRAQAKQKGSSTAETDVRRGLEGPAKNRLSVPLRNIFRFR